MQFYGGNSVVKSLPECSLGTLAVIVKENPEFKNLTQQMDNKQIEEIYNQAFGGLTLFYRDTTLSENLISKYKVGQILTERGFTDMSYKGGGLATNFRYLIASPNAKDLSAFNPDSAQFGHTLLSSNAFFKVLDIYKIGDKTQIFLLEIPSTAIDFFAGATSNIEDDITKKARESFDTKINSELIAELQTKEWKDRTEFPIGMNDKGEFFYQKDNKSRTTTTVNNPKTEQNIKTNSETKQNKPWWKFW